MPNLINQKGASNYLLQSSIINNNTYKLIISLIIFFTSILFPARSFSQTGCKTGCTSNDVQISKAYLMQDRNGTPLQSCESGASVEAVLYLELTTNTPRVGVSISASIVQDNQAETLVQNVGECFGQSLASSGVTIVKFQTPINWTCGMQIKLKDVLIGWGTGNTNFCTGSAAQCPGTSSKCWRQGPTTYIPVVTFPCVAPSITTQPGNQSKCENENASFSFTYNEGSPSASIQWQQSTDNGNSWSNLSNNSMYSGVTTTTLNITGVTMSMNAYRYKAILTNNTSTHNCGNATNGNATLSVNARPSTPLLSILQPTCTNSNGSVTVTSPVDGNGIDYEYRLGNGSWTDDVTFTVSANANYIIAVRNKLTQCAAVNNATGTMGSQPAASGNLQVSVTQPTCANSNGIVTVTAPLDDANVDYEYSANNGQSYQESVHFNVPAGNSYSITAKRKQSGCISNAVTGTMGAQPSAPPAPKAEIISNVSCSSATGTIKIVIASSGADYNTAEYEFSNGGSNWGSNPVFTFVAGGGYDLRVRRKNNITCVASATCAAQAPVTSINQEQSGITLNHEELKKSSKVVAAPNPFNDKIRFRMESAQAGYGSLELFNLMGQKIKTVYQGQFESGTIQIVEYSIPGIQRADLIYVFRVGNDKTSGKLIHIK